MAREERSRNSRNYNNKGLDWRSARHIYIRVYTQKQKRALPPAVSEHNFHNPACARLRAGAHPLARAISLIPRAHKGDPMKLPFYARATEPRSQTAARTLTSYGHGRAASESAQFMRAWAETTFCSPVA